ncbi:putative lipoprotein [Vibrio cholerae]|nr:putative lipoprotein [Vibrio cholerae]
MKWFLAFWLVFVSFFSVGLHANDAVLQQAYQSQQSDLQVQGFGQVVKVLPDDNDGSKHQKFILKLNSGQTLLVAHNIDLAPRIPNLKVGDSVEFYGEYEWNKKSGVLHWTHKDPQNRHAHGWLKHNGQLYE